MKYINPFVWSQLIINRNNIRKAINFTYSSLKRPSHNKQRLTKKQMKLMTTYYISS